MNIPSKAGFRKSNPQGADFVSPPLTDISVAYMQDANFVAGKVWPNVPVKKQAATFPFFPKGDFYRVQAKRRAPGTPSAVGGFRVKNVPYYCEPWALNKPITAQDRANYPDSMNADTMAAEFVMQQILLLREVTWAALAFAASVWATEKTGGVDFTSFLDATVDPLDTLAGYVLAASKQTGLKMTHAVIPPDVFKVIKFHALVKQRTQYTSPDSITEALVARIIGVDEVVVPTAVVNIAPETADKDAVNMSWVFPNHILLQHAAKSPGLGVPSAGYHFAWAGLEGGTDGVATSMWYDPARKADIVETELADSPNVVCPDLGVLLKTPLAPVEE